MKIDATSGMTFGNNPTTMIKRLMRNRRVYADVKPIKNYSQYLREYGLLKETTKVNNELV